MKKIIFACFLVIFINGCAEKAPVSPDGESQIIIKAFWNSSVDSIPKYSPMANAQVILSSEYGIMVKYTDNYGFVDVANIPSSVYSLSVRMTHPSDPGIMLVAAKTFIEVFSGRAYSDTVYAKPVSQSGISINELYVTGTAGTRYYYFDQFIELYNSGEDIKYLDGMMVMKFSGNSTDSGHKGQGADEGDDGDIDGVTYAYKFPGKPGERNYPFPPKKFLVLATVAMDHRNTAPQSIDLSKADWEFFNQYSVGEIDNPYVPDLINMRSDTEADFLCDLQSGVVVLSNGEDPVWTDGIDVNTVIDGIEYRSSTVKIKKTLDSRVDRGLIISPPRYSGQSMQRRDPGFDTNDGHLDLGIIAHPTPGYQ